ncbi:MAG: hypothetical protein WDA12_00620 [Bacilli bacterium]
MWEIDMTMDSIGAYLEQIRLLKAQPQVNDAEIDNVMWKVLGLALKLDEMHENIYRNELERIENTETITIREELLKRERILELSQARESVLNNLFDQNIPEEKTLFDLFEDIRREHEYETTFHESDVLLVKEQLELVEENKVKEQLLKEEYNNNNIQITNIEDSIMSFEDFNEKLNEEYARFIETNEIDKIDVAAASATKLVALERQSIVSENLRLLETANNIDVKSFKYLGDRYENDKLVIEEANELLFMVDLATKMREEVNSYEELQRKTEEISKIVAMRENDFLSRYSNITYPNDFSYRTIFFNNDMKLVNEQINAKANIETLNKRNEKINQELEDLYNNVKGRRELDDIINNRVGNVEKPIEFEEPVIVPIELEEENKENEINQAELTEEVVDNSNELDEEVLEVKSVEKAKPSLLAKLKLLKFKLMKLSDLAAPVILAGAILILTMTNPVNNNNKQVEYDIPTVGIENQIEEQIENETITSADDLLEAIETLEQEQAKYVQTIGDKVSVENDTKYYRDAASAQLDNNSYVTGRNGLRAENYNINRIAIMEKDMLGNPTGKILAVNTTPGVSAEELAESLGLEPEQYEVMIHIGAGDDNGNYVEAPSNAPSADDLCWMRADNDGIKIVTPASEILNSGKGITR